MAELLVFNPITSASASLMRMEISTTKHSVSCNPILPSRQMYTITMARKTEATMAVMKTMKSTTTTTMALMNWQEMNKRLGVTGKVVLIVI